jgi:DNA-binding NarL/FixJ family response regulator
MKHERPCRSLPAEGLLLLPDEGITVTKRFHDRQITKIKTVMNSSAYIDVAMAAGARAFINKHNMHVELISALISLLPAKVVSQFNLHLVKQTPS